MATLTLNLSEQEMAALNKLAEDDGISKTAVLRQALRLYQLVKHRIRAGEQLYFSGDQERIIEFIGPGFNALAGKEG